MQALATNTGLEAGILEQLAAGVAHLGVGSLGLCLAAGLALLMLFLWRRQPLASYRMVVAVLVATLLLPLGQWVAQRSPLLQATPLAQRLAAVLPEWTRSPEALQGHAHDTGTPQLTASGAYHVILSADLEYAQAPGALHALELPREGVAGPAPDGTPEIHGTVLLAMRSDDLPGTFSPGDDPILLGSIATEGLGGSGVPRKGGAPWTLAALIPAALLTTYAIGLLVALARTGLRIGRTRRLLADAVDVQDRETLEVWSEVLAGSPLAGRVALRASHEIDVPMCFGLRRPVVLLPASGEPKLARDVLACVLLHELVHLERRDTWVMLGQEIVRSIFWFHPVAWWLCKRIDTLRELSCDYLVVRRTGRRRRYATALVEYAEWMRRGVGFAEPQAATALLPWTTSKSQLARRIEMLVALNSHRPNLSRRPMILAAGSLFVALWGGQLAVAAAMSSPQEGRDADDEAECANCRSQVEERRIRLPKVSTGKGTTLGGKLKGVVVLDEKGEAHALEGIGSGQGRRWAVSSDDEQPRTIGLRIRAESPGGKGGNDDERIVIEEVIAGSLGERSGLEAHDVIVSIDGEGASLDELRKAKQRLGKQKVKVKVLREGDQEIVLELDDAPTKVLELKGRGGSSRVLDLRSGSGTGGVLRLGGQDDDVRVLRLGEGVGGIVELDRGDGDVQVIELDALSGSSDGSGRAYQVLGSGDGYTVIEVDAEGGAGRAKVKGKSKDKAKARYQVLPRGKVILGDAGSEGEGYTFSTESGLIDLTEELGYTGENGEAVIVLDRAKDLLKKRSKGKANAGELYGRAKGILELREKGGQAPLIYRLESDDAEPNVLYRVLRSEEESDANDASGRIEELRRELDQRAKELDALRRELDELRRSRTRSRDTASAGGATLLPALARGTLR